MIRFPHGYFGWQGEPEENKDEDLHRTAVGEAFPACRLVLLDGEKDRAYLGIRHREKTITLEDIASPYLFVEIYNEGCLACLDEVKSYTALYRMLGASQGLKDKVRMAGIGVESKKRRVAQFRRENGIPFPLFADENREIFECLGRPVLPAAYLIALEPEMDRKIILIHSGHMERPEDLMEKIEESLAKIANQKIANQKSKIANSYGPLDR